MQVFGSCNISGLCPHLPHGVLGQPDSLAPLTSLPPGPRALCQPGCLWWEAVLSFVAMEQGGM